MLGTEISILGRTELCIPLSSFQNPHKAVYLVIIKVDTLSHFV
jgi:hypothetical protein